LEYIKRQAIGIGLSEKLRVRSIGAAEEFKRTMEELFKVGATLVIALFYFLTGRFSKAIMLIKFRLWVLNGFYSLH